MLGDTTDDEFVMEDEAENPALVVKRLREKLNKAEEERAQYLEGWQRSKADFVNFRKDEESRRSHTEERIKASVAEDIIPVLDSFEMAAKHTDNKEFTVLHKQLLDVIKRMGIERFGKVGEPFNPRTHEAVREVPVEKKEEDHTVVSVERSGYTLGDFVIRPAQVSVGTIRGSEIN
jgi:molecular chaperone GrpE